MKTFLLYTVLTSLFLVRCASPEKIIYFQDINEEIDALNTFSFDPIIQSNDQLTITVSNINPETAKPFNSTLTRTDDGNSSSGRMTVEPYTVDAEGYINFPVLGKIYVQGYKKSDLLDDLKNRLRPYLKSPIININIINYKVTVLGEVNTPGTFPINGERITILEALGLAGDLTIHAKRDGILLIRETEGKRISKRIDLTKSDILSSDFYYLHQNDVIYVEPNNSQINNSKYNSLVPVSISVASIIITIISLIIRN